MLAAMLTVQYQGACWQCHAGRWLRLWWQAVPVGPLGLLRPLQHRGGCTVRNHIFVGSGYVSTVKRVTRSQDDMGVGIG